MSHAAKFSEPSGGSPIASDTGHCEQKQILCAPGFLPWLHSHGLREPGDRYRLVLRPDLAPTAQATIGCDGLHVTTLPSEGAVRTALLSDTESLTGKYEERFPEVFLAAASLH